MPVEKSKFDKVDQIWQSTMSKVNQNPNIFEAFDWEGTKANFENSNKTLDEVQKSLSNYLESKRR